MKKKNILLEGRLISFVLEGAAMRKNMDEGKPASLTDGVQ